MATFISGTTATVTLDEYDTLAIEGNARLTIATIGLPTSASDTYGQITYGPYGAVTTITIFGLGSGSYTTQPSLRPTVATVIDMTAAQIAAPTAAQLRATNVTYQLNQAPYNRYASNGTALVEVGSVAASASGIFRGPYVWDARPVTGLTVGDTFRASDVGAAPGTIFMWTGSAWRNLYPYTIGSNVGSVASPVATISAATSGVFTIPTPISIPADLFAAGSRATLVAVLRKNGATATNTWNAYLGTAGGITDSLIRTEAGTINNGRNARFDVDLWFPSTTVCTGVQNVAPQANGTNAVTDVSTNINTAAAMSVTIAVAAGNVGDSYQLLSCGLVVGA